MEPPEATLAARGITDERDRLLSADEALAELQESCGGVIPGPLAIPELLDLVGQARQMGLKIAREFSAFDGTDVVSGFARIVPLEDDAGGGCELLVDNWQRSAGDISSTHDLAERLDIIDRASAEITARLDSTQKLQLLTALVPDADEFHEAVKAGPGKVWTEYVSLSGVAHQQPLHWRLLDGAHCKIPGSLRSWRARLLPIGPRKEDPRGFELLFIADEPLINEFGGDGEDGNSPYTRLIGGALTPVLRQPIARIVANAETIQAKLAGPLRSEYSEYAGNIAMAGQHLSGMLDDLADLEVVESAGFSTAKEKVDLADAARRAGGILGVRAQSRSITLELPEQGKSADERAVANAEFRRVLQVLINLIGNAIAYSPEGSTVTVETRIDEDDGMVAVSVADQGPGISPEQRAKIFEKFERLGRDSDGGKDTGSGLGLYISRRLAVVMGGDLSVEASSPEGMSTGAVFTLRLPSLQQSS
ncbi:sensor histidine kinase [Erythrobacter rubeus]|uniref:histidine kinase n=1 Tax=Erythrobacter rubeus TaxID=2760803 RepID=A0ABR8KME4_9SPHN|nr:HAMP domain-containing sensor histidine kinase [Erythrobacter rubeus]MBD2841718.1 HAMP domain-containing histidine kinase [Erythrobacter rubeus]